MKREDIDKKIGMPDVNAEWAKFEREVINQKAAPRKPLYWAIGIAASIALVTGIFLLSHNAEEPQQTIAQQKAPTMQIPSAKDTVIEAPVKSIATPEKNMPAIGETKQRPSSESLAADMYPTTKKNTQEQAADDELQSRIAGLSIEPTSADLGPGNTMRLAGIRIAGTDSVIIGRKTNRDFLVVVNGQPLSEAEQKQILSSDFHIYFFNRQQFVDSIYVSKNEDFKRPYIEKYGERAKNAVMVITTVPDTLCDAYVQQHPELMQTRHRVEGYVVNKDTQEPLPDTWIKYRNIADMRINYTDGAGAATDSTGHFILWLPRKDVNLLASRVGYITVSVNHPIDTALTIRMTPANILRDVKVKPKESQ